MLASGVFDRPAYKWWVFSAVALGTLTSVINHGGMSVALPTIAQHFDADLSAAQWVVVAEGLAVSALILPMGRLSDIIGRKTVYLTGMAIFAGAALLAAGSQSILMLIAFKAVQGVGAAMTQGTGMAMITSVFPAEERGKGIGSHASVVGTGGVLGPVAGGFLITALDWRWLFYVNVLMGILAIIVVVAVVRGQAFSQDTRSRSYDFPGAALSTAVLVTFLLAVSNGASLGWSSPPIVVAGLAFVVLLAAFIWWESRAPSPMLDLGLFRNRVFGIGISTNFMSFLGITSARFLLPFYLQAALGYTPALVGLVLLPNAVSRIIMGPVSGRLSDRYGWRLFNVAGLLLSAAGLFTLASITVSSSIVVALVGIVLHSAGSGLFPVPQLRLDFQFRRPEKTRRGRGVRESYPKRRERDRNRNRRVHRDRGNGEPGIRAEHRRGARCGARLQAGGLVHDRTEGCLPGDGLSAVDRGRRVRVQEERPV